MSVRLVQELLEEFDGEVMRAHRKEAARWLLSVLRASPDDGQIPVNLDVAAIMRFFERVGLLIERGALDEYLLWSEFRSPVKNYGSAIRNVEEKLGGERHRFYQRAYALFKRFDDIERKESELSGTSQDPYIAFVDSLLLDPWLEHEAQQETG